MVVVTAAAFGVAVGGTAYSAGSGMVYDDCVSVSAEASLHKYRQISAKI